jgi:hypothetical protein
VRGESGHEAVPGTASVPRVNSFRNELTDSLRGESQMAWFACALEDCTTTVVSV